MNLDTHMNTTNEMSDRDRARITALVTRIICELADRDDECMDVVVSNIIAVCCKDKVRGDPDIARTGG